ncbi:hypothetical protein ACN47E_010023 [Coniothyrium glycines]
MLATVSRHSLDIMTTSSLPIILPPRPALQRPKLSINTEQPRILGKAASLRLETLSAVSPTVRNTFSNACEQPSTAPALHRPTKPRLAIDSHFSASQSASTPDSASTLSSALTSASHDSATSLVPYKQPHHLTSILANSPARSLVTRKMAASRPMFPAEKRVSFRTPIEEEIKTVKYTLAHSDLSSSSSTLSSITLTASAPSTKSDSSATLHSSRPSNTNTLIESPPSSLLSSTDKISCASISKQSRHAPRTGEKRDSSSSEDDSDSCLETPVAGRRKRSRDWRWTLGPLPGSSSSPSSTSSITTGEDSAQYAN